MSSRLREKNCALSVNSPCPAHVHAYHFHPKVFNLIHKEHSIWMSEALLGSSVLKTWCSEARKWCTLANVGGRGARVLYYPQCKRSESFQSWSFVGFRLVTPGHGASVSIALRSSSTTGMQSPMSSLGLTPPQTHDLIPEAHERRFSV